MKALTFFALATLGDTTQIEVILIARQVRPSPKAQNVDENWQISQPRLPACPPAQLPRLEYILVWPELAATFLIVKNLPPLPNNFAFKVPAALGQLFCVEKK